MKWLELAPHWESLEAARQWQLLWVTELAWLIITLELTGCPRAPHHVGLKPSIQLQQRVTIRPGPRLENAVTPVNAWMYVYENAAHTLVEGEVATPFNATLSLLNTCMVIMCYMKPAWHWDTHRKAPTSLNSSGPAINESQSATKKHMNYESDKYNTLNPLHYQGYVFLIDKEEQTK